MLLSLVLALAAFFYGGVLPQHWNPCLLALGATACILWLPSRREELAPPLSRLHLWLLVTVTALLLIQVVPLPVAILQMLSPARAETLSAMSLVSAEPAFATLSVLPSGTIAHLLRVFAYLVVMLAVRQILWNWRSKPWLLVLPIVTVAVLEAALGIAQSYLSEGNVVAHGTYVNRNHFSGLLELALPFVVVYPLVLLKENRDGARMIPVLLASGGWACATVVLVGVLFSLSRMGFVAALSGLAAIGLLSAFDTFSRGPSFSVRNVILTAAAVVAAVLLGFILLPSDPLIQRFAEVTSTDQITHEGRLLLWRETLDLVADYPLLGVGLGTYGTAFQKYKVSAPMVFDDNAHNDYLQVLSETGVFGFGLLAVFAAVVLWQLVANLNHPNVGARYLAIACLGSLTAISLHSFVDYNLYMPANAMTLAWICGISFGLRFIPDDSLAETRLSR